MRPLSFHTASELTRPGSRLEPDPFERNKCRNSSLHLASAAGPILGELQEERELSEHLVVLASRPLLLIHPACPDVGDLPFQAVHRLVQQRLPACPPTPIERPSPG